MQKLVRFFISIVIVSILLGVSLLLLIYSQKSVAYLGLPSVPCVDSTLPVLQQFTVTIAITINGRLLPLSSTIGHDPGDCLRVIHTEDTSGMVTVQANDNDTYTLQQFFGVWRKNFGKHELMGYQTDAMHDIVVYKDGTEVHTFGQTQLTPGSTYLIRYTPVGSHE